MYICEAIARYPNREKLIKLSSTASDWYNIQMELSVI